MSNRTIPLLLVFWVSPSYVPNRNGACMGALLSAEMAPGMPCNLHSYTCGSCVPASGNDTHSCASLRRSLASLNHTVSHCSRAPRRTKAVRDARSSLGEGWRCCCCCCCGCCSLWSGSRPRLIPRWVVRRSCSCRPSRQEARMAFRSSGCRWAQATDATRRKASGDAPQATAGPALSAPPGRRFDAPARLTVYLMLMARHQGAL